MITQFFVPDMEAVPKGSVKYVGHTRPRAGQEKGRAILVPSAKNLKKYEKAVADAARGVGMYPVDGPIHLSIMFVRRPRANAPKTYTPFVTTYPDLDKTARAVLDALTGVAYRDDAQVCGLELGKVYQCERYPRIGTTVTVRAGKDIPSHLGEYSPRATITF